MKEIAIISAILTIIRKLQMINKTSQPKKVKTIEKKEF